MAEHKEDLAVRYKEVTEDEVNSLLGESLGFSVDPSDLKPKPPVVPEQASLKRIEELKKQLPLNRVKETKPDFDSRDILLSVLEELQLLNANIKEMTTVGSIGVNLASKKKKKPKKRKTYKESIRDILRAKLDD